MSSPADPDTARALTQHLVQLRRRVDDHVSAAVARSPDAFSCAPGCDRCCHARFSVFAVEAAPIREALAALAQDDPQTRARLRAQGDDPDLPHCALLLDRRCAVYEQRPMICRSHGLPIAVPDESAGPEDDDRDESVSDAPGSAQTLRVDHCPLNFAAGQPIPRPSILLLEAVNRPLSVLATLWAPDAERIDLAQLAAER